MYKIIIVLLLVAFAGLFFIKGPSGEPFLTLEDFKPAATTLAKVSDMLDETKAGAEGQATQVYKWQDENGLWHFSNRAEDENGAEVIELDGIINTMAPIEVLERNSPAAVRQVQTSSLPSLTTVPLSQAMDTTNQARQLQQTLDDRKAELDKAIAID